MFWKNCNKGFLGNIGNIGNIVNIVNIGNFNIIGSVGNFGNICNIINICNIPIIDDLANTVIIVYLRKVWKVVLKRFWNVFPESFFLEKYSRKFF